MFWLSCVRAGKEIGRLEGSGVMDEINARLHDDPGFARDFRAAQEAYVRRRDALRTLPDAGGVGGGPRDRVKCLHAHYAHHAATGENPVGAEIAGRIDPLLRPPPCVRID